MSVSVSKSLQESIVGQLLSFVSMHYNNVVSEILLNH